MSGRLVVLITCLSLLLGSGCAGQRENLWAQTTASIVPFIDPDGEPGFTIIYDAPESTAINAEGQAIKGPIEQHVVKRQAQVEEQKIKIRYLRDEPVIFEYITLPKEK
ncbi:hypothetical protein [Endozoicomonas sp. Mp262]|uniref:hypothetical protein n=1 Tax=Endozoicomonas sp. Mp262 TaxID=2919499 RepID=UPI0021DA77D1